MSHDALLLAASFAVRQDTPFAFSINKKPLWTYSNFLDRARNYINAEALTSKKFGATKTSRATEADRRKEKKRLAETLPGESQQPREDKKPRDSGSGYKTARAGKQRNGKYHELTALIEEILVNSWTEVDF